MIPRISFDQCARIILLQFTLVGYNPARAAPVIPATCTYPTHAAITNNSAYVLVLPVISRSTISPGSITVKSENIFEGVLNVAGEIPFYSAVEFGGTLPSGGLASVNYACDNPEEITNKDGSIWAISNFDSGGNLDTNALFDNNPGHADKISTEWTHYVYPFLSFPNEALASSAAITQNIPGMRLSNANPILSAADGNTNTQTNYAAEHFDGLNPPIIWSNTYPIVQYNGDSTCADTVNRFTAQNYLDGYIDQSISGIRWSNSYPTQGHVEAASLAATATDIQPNTLTDYPKTNDNLCNLDIPWTNLAISPTLGVVPTPLYAYPTGYLDPSNVSSGYHNIGLANEAITGGIGINPFLLSGCCSRYVDNTSAGTLESNTYPIISLSIGDNLSIPSMGQFIYSYPSTSITPPTPVDYNIAICNAGSEKIISCPTTGIASYPQTVSFLGTNLDGYQTGHSEISNPGLEWYIYPVNKFGPVALLSTAGINLPASIPDSVNYFDTSNSELDYAYPIDATMSGAVTNPTFPFGYHTEQTDISNYDAIYSGTNHIADVNRVFKSSDIPIADGFNANAFGSSGSADFGGCTGIGEGKVSVIGELPVTGGTYVNGQVPITGSVKFGGTISAVGSVCICGFCSCN